MAAAISASGSPYSILKLLPSVSMTVISSVLIVAGPLVFLAMASSSRLNRAST
jgi:hypothetical protein